MVRVDEVKDEVRLTVIKHQIFIAASRAINQCNATRCFSKAYKMKIKCRLILKHPIYSNLTFHVAN